jgi:nucleoside-diphosphate-sugar epimerase
MSTVLVTGATGFIGGHLAEALVDAGHEVTCLVRATSDRSRLEPLGVRFAEGDINDQASLAAAIADAGAEVVYHLAAMLKQPWHPEFLTTNADGVRLVARACADAGGPVLLSVSSIAAAGPARHGRPLVESDPPEPVSRYGRSKLGGEEAARELAGRVPITIVRPPAVVGERDTASLPLFEMAARGFHPVPGRGQDRLSMVHVGDLVAAIIAAAERGERLGDRAGQGIYFAAADEQPTIRELGELLAPAVGRDRVRVVPAPRLLSKLVGAAAEGVARARNRPSILNYDKMIEANAGSWICSTDKARDQLGWAPAEPLGDRLAQTGAWYRDQGWI